MVPLVKHKRIVYAVLAQERAISKAMSGNRFIDVHNEAVRSLTDLW